MKTFLTFVLNGGEWLASHLGNFTPWGKSPRYPLNRRLAGWVPLSVWLLWKRKKSYAARNRTWAIALPTDKGMVQSDMSKPALIFFFTARIHKTKSTVKILAANTHCKYFLKITKVTHFLCTWNSL
jgi:hypothetical protein